MNILKKSLTKKDNAAPPAPSDAAPPADKAPPPSVQPRASAGGTGPNLTISTKGEAPPGTQIHQGSVVIGTPMSDSIFDHILGRGRAVDIDVSVQSAKKKPTTPTTPTVRFSAMDSNVEFWDKDGIHRRSGTITRRMNLRGVAVPNAVDPTSLVDSSNDADAVDDVVNAKSRPSSPSRQEIDSVSKRQIASKQNHIQAVDAALERSLAEAYKPPPLSKLALADSQHTANAPSKQLQYVDDDGNVRRLKRSAHDTPRSEPPPTPTPPSIPV